MPAGDARVPIVVALSGGVDSATAAALLVESGARVVGIAMRLAGSSGDSSTGPNRLEDARRVCAHLGIPFYVQGCEEEFRREVIDEFVAEYRRGRTPNPCIRCNQRLKFAVLLRRARSLGAAAFATGHYARIATVDGRRLLRRGADPVKDQSYMLYHLRGEDLAFVRFPVGELTKQEVRAHARRLGLPVAEQPESEDICFVPGGDYARFVAAWRSDVPLPGEGEIVDLEGNVVGRHAGLHRYTVGQRRGLGLACGQPMYVVALDPTHNRLVVGPAAALGRERLTVGAVVWSAEAPARPVRCLVQIRYRHAARPATVTPLDGGRAEVAFDAPERAIAPGQAAVFYDGELVVGGGIIE